MNPLENKIALVTGAARGIGQAIALQLAADGADLALCDVKAEWLEDTAAKVKALGRRAEVYAMDVSAGAAVGEAVAQVAADFGRIDVLVNNAGITRDTLLIRMSEEDWDAVLDINLKGAFLVTKAVAKIMMKQRSGSIVNIASVVGVMGNPGQVNYSASKGGLIAMTRTTGQGTGQPQRPHQRGRPRLYPHGDDRQAAGGGQGGHAPQRAAGASRRTRRCGQGGRLFGRRPCRLCERADPARLRRHDLVI
jgi:NAD(P)-dependent dehydrogenase (short-subunit alcohol dehydrogenase family)